MATYSATGLAIFDPSLDPPLDNRPKPSSAQSASVCVHPPPSCPKCTIPDPAAPGIRPATSTAHGAPSLDVENSLGVHLARPTPRETQGEPDFSTPSEVYRTPHEVLGSCATISLYLSPMVDLKTPTSTYNEAFASPETTPAISYYESTKGTPDVHQMLHTADDPSTVEGSRFSPSIYQTPFELVSIGAIDYRPTLVMNQFAPASSLDKQRHSSLSMSPEAPLEQDFHTPDGSPLSPYHTPPELLLEFRPSGGHRASATFGHPLSFLSFSSPSSPRTSRGTPMMHDAPILDSTYPSTTSSKEERSPILEVFQAARRARNQRLHTTPLRRSRSSISLMNTGSPPEGSLRAREMLELAEELQKARVITEDFVRSSPGKKTPPENQRLVRDNTFGCPPSKHGRHASTSGGWIFDPGHVRFPSNSTTSTAFFDIEGDDGGNLDEMKPSRKSLSIITTWPTWAATPPPLLSPFKEKSDKAARDDDPLITPTIETAEPTVPSTPLIDSLVLPGDPDQAPLKQMQSQSDASSNARTPSYSSSPPLKEKLRVQDAPAIVVEHPDLCQGVPTEKSEPLAEEYTASGGINSDAQVLKRPTTKHGFTESSSSALGVSPSIYLSPMHEARFSNNSLDLAKIIKPDIDRGLSTPSFISGVLQAGLLLEKLERENTASFEEDMEDVHFQVLTAVVGTGNQASSSSSLSHYSAEDSSKHSQPDLSSPISAGTLYVTAADLSTIAQAPNGSAPLATLHDSSLQPPSDHPPRFPLPPASTFVVNPLPRPSSITVSDSASFVQSLTKSFELDRGAQLLKLPSTVDTTEPVSTRSEGAPSNNSLGASDSKSRPNIPTDSSSFNRELSTESEEGSKSETRAVTPSRVRRSSNRSTGQSSENHPSSSQRISTLHPLSASGSASVSPVSPSSVISRASARLVNPFSFLHPSPLSSTSQYTLDTSPAGPRKLAKTPEQPRGHQRSGTVMPGDMKRPSSARRRLSRLLGAVEFGIGKASPPTDPEDKAGLGLVVPDVFGAGEGRESWIRNSREHATDHEGLASSDTNAGRKAVAAVQEEKSEKRRLSLRPTSMIWLGSNKEKSPMAARDGIQPTKVPLALQPSVRPQPSNNSSNWSMLNASVSGAVGNIEGLRIINLPPPPAVGATIDVPKAHKAHKSRSRRRSMTVSSGGEEDETEGGQMKGRSRSSFLGAFIRK